MTGDAANDERAELERLRAEVAALRAAAGPVGRARGARAPGRAGRRWRWAGVTAALVLACLLAPLSVAAVWARGQVTDTDRYVATVAPLARDPAVQEAITADITDTVFRYVDVQDLVQRAFAALADPGPLPPELAARLAGLAGPVAGGIRSFTADQVRKVVQSDLFAQAWVAANRSAHEQLVAALTGRPGGAVVVEGNAVKLDLAAFLTVVKQQLVAAGFDLANRIPTVHATFVVFESADVGRVQRGFTLLDRLGAWLPLILAALAALAIYLAPARRPAWLGAGLGLAIAMLAAGALLALARRAYLAGVPADVLPLPAAASLYDTVVRFLREAIRAGFLLGLVVAAGAVLTGPSAAAVAIRRWLAAGLAAARRALAGLGMRLDGVAGWLAPRAALLRGLVIAAAFAALLLTRYRTPGLVGWLTVGVVGGLAVIQFLATDPTTGPAAGPAHAP